MGILDRYKKRGGFNQLLLLLESSTYIKQEKFLKLISIESPVWESALRKRMITMARIQSWDSANLFEIVSRIQPEVLAYALHGDSESKVKHIISSLSPILQRKIKNLMGEMAPTPSEKEARIQKMISDIRDHVSKGLIKMDKIDQDAVVEDNLENLLVSQTPSIKVEHPSFQTVAPEIGSSSSVGLEGLKEFKNIVNEQEVVASLQHKIRILQSELDSLKSENLLIKEKLEKIRRIL
jgi:hypothetical protein